ncbi:predicted protein [Nematostella vectensis]|uniref:Phospholipid/glycerol acyltransferase domain-containing protein n=1 Tax=Nematostella vectensis TaxID=45351 RepID=A7RI88_NEMVE|nr:predicted protein [Nematostella vectensis]|eukprot:XP_001640722.1 predicted protein [Nematostella vectensis]
MDPVQMKKLEDVYSKWERKSGAGKYGNGSESLADGGSIPGKEAWIQRFGNVPRPLPNRQPPRFARSGRRRGNRQMDDIDFLASATEKQFEVTPAAVPSKYKRDRPFMGDGCPRCHAESSKEFFSPDIPSQGMHNILNMAVYSSGLLAVVFLFVLARQGAKLHNEKCFSRQGTTRCLCGKYAKSMNNPILIAVQDFENLERERQKKITALNKQASGIVSNMASAIYRTLIKFTGWFLFKLFGKLLDGIQFHKGQIEMLQRAAQEGKPMVFLPLHKSHLDYVLVTWILLTCDIKPPHVAAGDNLKNMLVFSWLMRHLGGFFIKRKLDHASGKDDLYKSVLQEYVQQLLKEKEYLEVFIEGSRSRTGKAMVPKSGLLSVVVNSVVEGLVPDVLIVPVNISYEKKSRRSISHLQEGKPMVFLPLHKSHLDYVLVTWILLTCDIKPPHVAAGDNLKNMLVFSWLMRHLGGFFIKRKLDHASGKDDLYKSVLQEYVQQLLKEKEYLEVFIEGSRSRTGKAMVPKSGLLSVVVNSVVEGLVPDVLIVPVNISYEKILETSYPRELLGEAKRPETFWEAVKGIWQVLGTKYGHVRVDFSQPFSLQGATLQALTDSFQWLRSEVISRGRDVGFSGETCDVLHHSLDLLRDLVDIETVTQSSVTPATTTDVTETEGVMQSTVTKVTPKLRPSHIINLVHYSNLVLAVFALESVLACSIVTVARENDIDIKDIKQEGTLPQSEIVEKAKDLCEILQKEFIFLPPCVSVEAGIKDALEKFITCEVIRCTDESRSTTSRDKDWSLGFSANTWEDDEDDCFGHEIADPLFKVASRASLPSEVRVKLSGDGCLITNNALVNSSQAEIITRENEFLSAVHYCAKERVSKDVTMFPESCSLEPLRNALRTFKELGVVELRANEANQTLLRLTNNYEDEEAVFELIDRIHQYKI